jgi:hypothetical protein
MDRHSTPPAASDPGAEGDEGAGKEAQVRQGAFGAEGGGKPTKAGERERMEPWSPGLGSADTVVGLSQANCEYKVCQETESESEIHQLQVASEIKIDVAMPHKNHSKFMSRLIMNIFYS